MSSRLAAPDAPLTHDRIERRVRELGPWFHNLDLLGVRTAPDHFLGDYPAVKWQRFSHAIPSDLRGKTVLDIGCNAGFYAIEMKRRGAARVLGLDHDPTYLAQAQFAPDQLGLDVELRLVLRVRVLDLLRDLGGSVLEQEEQREDHFSTSARSIQ